MSIKTKLLIVLLLPSLFICIATFLFMSQKATTELSQDNLDKMNFQLNAYSELLSADIHHAESDVQGISRYLEEVYLPNEKAMQSASTAHQTSSPYNDLLTYVRLLSNASKDLNYYVYFVDTSAGAPESFGYGDYSGDDHPDPMPMLSKSYFATDVLSKEKAWYFDALKTGKALWYGPLVKYEGVLNKELMVYSKAIYDNNQVFAVVGVDYPIAKIHRFVSGIQYYDTGYAALMNDQYKLLSHPSIPVGYSVSDIYPEGYGFVETELKSHSSGSISYVWTDQREKSLAFITLSNGWKLILTAYIDEVMKPALDLKSQMTLVFGLAICLTAFSAYLASHTITKPLILLSQEMKSIVSSNDAREFSYLLTSRKDQVGLLAVKLATFYRRYLNISGELKFLTTNLSFEIETRNMSLLETNALLAEKQLMLKKQRESLQSQNQQLEASIQTLSKTQHLLIAEEKLASFSEIVHGISLEIEPPIAQNYMLATELDTSYSKLTRLMLKSEYSRQVFMNVYENALLKNRKLIGNLLFSKDIIDYIKDLTAAKTFRQLSIIELYDYLDKAKAYLDNVPLTYPPVVHIKSGDLIFLELEATKFLHLVSSLLIHIATSTQLKTYSLHMRISPIVIDHKLIIKIADNTFGTTDSQSFCDNEQLSAQPNVYMGLSMIQILIRESFNGTLEVVQKPGEVGTQYILSFPHVLYEPSPETSH